MSRVQQLIVEVLKSRATRRDSKTYLDMFVRQPGRAAPGASRARPPGEAPSRTAAASASVTALGLPSSQDLSALAGSLQIDPQTTADRVSLAVPSLDEAHTALVKLQGPFTDRQLQSIAEGLVYLQTLGLVSLIVLDDARWPRAPRFTADGHRLEEDLLELSTWTSARRPLVERAGLAEAGHRSQMVHELWRVSDALARAGADPRPQAEAAVRVSSRPNAPANAVASRAPLDGDANLTHAYAALREGRIPVLIPLALDETDSPRGVCVDADDVMVVLAREMASLPPDESRAMDLAPLRLMVITNEGGIPSHARNGDPHLMINLASEYDLIRSSFIWSDTHPTALSNLRMVRDCLAHMPSISSGVMVSHRSPQSLIANLITNKAAYSPSLPPRLLAARREMRHMPTVIRAGLPVRVVSDWDTLDLGRVQEVLETSFGRKLDADAYWARLRSCLDFMILIGDYDGLAIVTKEYAPGDDRAAVAPIAYLDKFAVLPKLQGSGAVDFLWQALRDEVHGLGLLDALNNNGGRCGRGEGRDLVWKSRAANPVNRWYFERSNGFVTLPGPAPDWYMFWCDAEDRLRHWAGQPLVRPGARLEDVWHATGSPTEAPTLPIVTPEEQGRLLRWARSLATIPSAWAR